MPRLPFRIVEPTFCAGLRDDPLLLVRKRPQGRSLLFDCGQMSHLAKRILRAIDTVFVTHMHMDHFMGLDTLVRHVHVAPRTLTFYGPPGLAARIGHKLAAYDWNLREPHWCTLEVVEVQARQLQRFALPGAVGFPLRECGGEPRSGDLLYRDPWVRVSAVVCDHRLPVLALRLDETPAFGLDPERLAAAGLAPGPWLRRLKHWFCHGQAAGVRVAVPDPGGGGREWPAEALYARIRQSRTPASIGYVTDVAWSEENRARLQALLGGVTLLVCECTFLAAERDKARASRHLCTSDVNALAATLAPAFLLPMHLSKTYQGRSAELYAELAPPPETTLLALPEHLPPRPLLPGEFPAWTAVAGRRA